MPRAQGMTHVIQTSLIKRTIMCFSNPSQLRDKKRKQIKIIVWPMADSQVLKGTMRTWQVQPAPGCWDGSGQAELLLKGPCWNIP